MQQPERVQVHPQFRYRLHELRQSAGLSLRELGRLAHYSHTYLHDLERGVKQPTAATAARLDDALSAGGMLTTLVTVPVTELRPPPPVPIGSPNITETGLEFAPDWRQAVDTATALWRRNVQGLDVLRMVGFTATAFLAPAMRWLTSPLDEQPVGRGTRLVGLPDVDTISRMTATLRGLDNHYGGGHIYPTVVRLLHGEVAPLLRDGRYDAATGTALFSAAAELTRLRGGPRMTPGCTGSRSGT